jgi:DNA-binding MarR family transcriptional regulator
VRDSQRVLDSIRRLVRLLRLSDRVAQSELGLSAAQLFVLQELAKTPALSLNDLAERTLTDQSSVSVVVSRLVQSGHVSRDRDPRDARRLLLNLTKGGRAIIQKAPLAAQKRLLDALERIGPADRKRFADTFVRLIEELGAEKGVAPMMFDDETPPSVRRTRKK